MPILRINAAPRYFHPCRSSRNIVLLTKRTIAFVGSDLDDRHLLCCCLPGHCLVFFVASRGMHLLNTSGGS